MTSATFAFTVSTPLLLLGLTVGLTYGLLAVGLILVYRSSRIINFAHGEIGGFGAAVLAVAVIRWHLPYPVAFALGLIGGACAAAAVELVVVRRLRNAPALMSVIATLGAGQFLLLFSLTFAGEKVRTSRKFPEPTFLPEFDVGALVVTHAHVAMIVLTPVVVAGLTLFLSRGRSGLQIRSAASNRDAARLSGVLASRMSTYAWAIAGSVAAFTAMLVFPTQGVNTPSSLGPSLLLRGLAAAVIARMDRLPIALGAGIALGVLEAVLRYNSTGGGTTEVFLFVVILAALLLQRREGDRGRRGDNWGVVEPWGPVPAQLHALWEVRNLGRVVAAVALFGAVVIGITGTNHTAIVLVSVLALSAIGLSLGVLTGLGGMLSLGQFAVAGIGAVAGYRTIAASGSVAVGFVAATVAGAVVSVLVGLPSLRLRGNMLAVTTLAFALVTQAWLLQQPWMLGSGVSPQEIRVGPWALDTGRRYYLFTLALFIVLLLLYRNLKVSGFGRLLRAVRDNEAAARAFAVGATFRKMQSFIVAGAMAGVGGMVYAFSLSLLTSQVFSTGTNITLVVMCLIGGLGLLVGPLVGALYIVALPAFLPLDAAGLASTALGWLILILYFPGGVAQMIAPLRARVIGFLARRRGVDLTLEASAHDLDLQAVRIGAVGRPVPGAMGGGGEPLLRVDEIRKHFGGVAAINGVSFTVNEGETIGLLGPNGAGKTTLFEVISGFTRQDSGEIHFQGTRVDGLSPEVRSRRGLIRSFQDGALFSTMTVTEILQLAQERAEPTRLLASLCAAPRAEARKRARAEMLIELMGLGPYRHRRCGELSTGTRRIAELACVVALEPKLLLLDEPSSGIAQRESEALGDVLRSVKRELGTTLLLVEHDVPLLMSLSDRVVAMAAGAVICIDCPADVAVHPEVVASYLGTNAGAIERSHAPVPR